jgi:hypothetical protein
VSLHAPKIGNKIWLERAWDEEQLWFRNVPQILKGSCTKIQRILCALNSHRNSLEILGTLEFDEIWLASSLLHLVSRKNKFAAKEDQKFEYILKIEFGLI